MEEENKKEILKELKSIYKKTGSKDETIEKGIEKYHLEKQMAISMVESIEKYYNQKIEKEQIQSSYLHETKHIYTSSYLRFFLYRTIPYIFACILTILVLHLSLQYLELTNLIRRLIKFSEIIILFLIIYLLFGIGYLKSDITIQGNHINYRGFLYKSYKDQMGIYRDFSRSINYSILKLEHVKETFNKIILYGEIEYLFKQSNNGPFSIWGGDKEKKKIVTKVKIIKMFKKNKELLDELKHVDR